MPNQNDSLLNSAMQSYKTGGVQGATDFVKNDINQNYQQQVNMVQERTGIPSLYETINIGNAVKWGFKGILNPDIRAEGNKVRNLLGAFYEAKMYPSNINPYGDGGQQGYEEYLLNHLKKYEDKYDMIGDQYENQLFEYGRNMNQQEAQQLYGSYEDFLKRFGLIRK
jgi:hypothetical protein